MPDLVEKYKKYRRKVLELNTKMVEKCITKDLLTRAGKYLGILKGKTLVFEYEDEVNVLMDFALHELKTDGKSAVEIYKEKYGGEDEIEEEILNAHLSSYTSLFEVSDIFREESTLLLKDLFRDEEIKLIDIGFSKTALKGLLVFIRVLPFKEFNIASGISFVFERKLKDRLFHKYEIFMKGFVENEIIGRFMCFHKLYRKYGIDVYYQHV